MEPVTGKACWYLKEVMMWRSIASAVWTWNITFPILILFLFGFSMGKSVYILDIYDFLEATFSLYKLGICLVIGTLTILLTWLHSKHYSVTSISPCNRLELLQQLANPSKLSFMMFLSIYSMLIAHFATSLISGRYTWGHLCDQSEIDAKFSGRLCQVGLHEMFVFFGFAIGFWNGFDRLFYYKYCLDFQNIREAKFLLVKCRFPGVIHDCAVKGAKCVYYYMFCCVFGILLREAVVMFSGMQARVLYSLQMWKIYQVIPVVWNMWLVGTLILLLVEVSWQNFNVYQTQEYTFLLHPVLMENQFKLLVENMEASSPSIAQHLALKQLSLIAKQKPSHRKQIFSLSRSTGNAQALTWNRIRVNCLNRIKFLTSEVNEFQHVLSGLREKHRSSQSICTLKTSADLSDSKPRCTDATLHFRKWATKPFQNNSSSVLTERSMPNMSVPTPRLWTIYSESTSSDDKWSCNNDCLCENNPSRTEFICGRIASSLRRLPICNYLLEMIPSWAASNVYREHLAAKWALQSISYFCAASMEEDRFGVVQSQLRDIITCLVDLLTALEDLGKFAIPSNGVGKLHHSLCNEVKSSLHRIIGAYGENLKSVNLPQEYQSSLLTFQSYDN